MTTYALLIYRSSSDAPGSEGPSEAEILDDHRALQAEAAALNHLHAVARLDEPGTARIVSVRANGHDVTDGPFVESKEWLVGFYLVDCDDEAQALARAKRICADTSHVIEVRPVNWRWRP
jgi:hypothetical protein